MQVVGAFKELIIDLLMWKIISLNGWKYLIVWDDLGSSLMYANCVLFNLLLFLIICLIMLSDNIIIELY